MTGESWVGWYRDRAGTEALTLSTDGRRLHVRIRGHELTGETFTGLFPDPEVPPDDGTFTLTPAGALCGCVLEWDIPMPVYDDGTVHRAALRCLLSLGRPAPGAPDGDPERLHLGLALHFDGALFTSGHAENDFAGALAEIQRQLPEGSYLKSCLSCAFSDYYPAGSGALFGGLACFRDAKDAYREAGDTDAVLAVWDRNSGSVQETHRCPDFERRPAEGPGTGHRGPFPPPRVELLPVQGDFKPPQASTA
ncbi:hypothetical protein GCM10010329_00720 [Streptomyces spiroverticillatus]|uniref:Uncharacterized protein n=1 Tax=Streptomyces finlayi TaxID=67296 RepID=A0A918WS45_9ACTN|nr:DUF6304 family protein [Streptomyces finlayi]GGZ85079.1 hypothetical protein GCM10010329_00720 [Streptomyces spiroverticillatus]GHC76782.1 hypothetical protein GCM10010334_00720 [Streptomyces finlayi]